MRRSPSCYTPRALLPLLLLLVIAMPVVAGCSTDDDGGEAKPGPANGVWAADDSWKVTLTQDAGKVTPGGASAKNEVEYTFRAEEVPTTTRNPQWKLHVTQEGAEGPFEAGWNLFYEERDGSMHLTRVGFADQEPVEAKLASIVLGVGFPLEQTYSKPPTDTVVDGDELLDQASRSPDGDLPPGLPNGDAPPVDAPTIEESGAPVP